MQEPIFVVFEKPKLSFYRNPNVEKLLMNMTKLNRKKILITGATGFIGGRLVEKLMLEHQVDVRVLVSTFTNVSRIARFDLEMFPGNLLNQNQINQAVKGCDIIFHCAYGNRGDKETRRRINIDGTRHIMEAAKHHGVKRVVYLSTLIVYGLTEDGDLDETAPRRYSGGIYADSKKDAEELVFKYSCDHGVPVTVIQPTAVYGPYAPVWTVNVMDLLQNYRFPLINGGAGYCNAVYIDDLVKAMLLAAENQEAVGEAFLISGKDPVTWKEFYGRFEQIISKNVTIDLSEEKARHLYEQSVPQKNTFTEAWKTLKNSRRLRRHIQQIPAFDRVYYFVKRNMQKSLLSFTSDGNGGFGIEQVPPVQILPPMQIDFYKTKTRVRIDKAREKLGYEPSYDFQTGMEITEQWIRAANLVKEEQLLKLI
jgi:nucleoside-diphosphate-sugar epimerase